MANPAVVNASPMIFLGRSGLLDFLHLAGDPVLVPLAVVGEIQKRGPADRAAQALVQASWLLTIDPGPFPTSIRQMNLGDGEASVLTWALNHPGTIAVLDDWIARRRAGALGITVTGTLGLVIAAKQKGRIPAARAVLEQLRQKGMFLSDQVMDQALAQIGE